MLHQQFTQNNGDSVSCDRINRGKQPSFLPSAYTFSSLFFCSFSSFTPYHPPHTVCSSLTLFLTLVIIIVPLPPLLCRVVCIFITLCVSRVMVWIIILFSFSTFFTVRSLRCVISQTKRKERLILYSPSVYIFFSLLFLSDLKKRSNSTTKKDIHGSCACRIFFTEMVPPLCLDLSGS